MSTDPSAECPAPGVTLLVFSCVGRAHLLQATLASFRRQCHFAFTEIIYAHDGEMDPAAPGWVGAHRMVQNCQRAGYVSSILQALAVVRTPYIFWLEDDWEFTHPVDVPSFLAEMERHPDWMQIRLSKIAPLTPEEIARPLDAPGLHRSGAAFSANPHLGRTQLLRDGFLAYFASPRTTANTFESFLEHWVDRAGVICAVLAPPGSSPSVAHTGYLESTGRQWHAAVTLAGKPTEYSSGMRGVGAMPPLWRRLALVGKLLLAAGAVGLRGLRRASAYDLGFRFIALTKHKDE
jgi:hypothetical protein